MIRGGNEKQYLSETTEKCLRSFMELQGQMHFRRLKVTEYSYCVPKDLGYVQIHNFPTI